MGTKYILAYAVIVAVFTVFSYGYVDLNLVLSEAGIYKIVQPILSELVFKNRPIATSIYVIFLAVLSLLYFHIVWRDQSFWVISRKVHVKTLISVVFLLFLAYPAVSYDVFNYISTAKVAFTHQENPYLTMPIEIPGEPFNAFTRAANKTALYGPVWILLTAIPWVLSGGNIWGAVITFKLLSAGVYLTFIYLIFSRTKSLRNVLFFALNPLVLIEVLVAGHNDLVMLLLALAGFFLWRSSRMYMHIAGVVLFILSWFIKGSTLLLAPLFFASQVNYEKLLKIAYWSMFLLFIVATPLREELYPWYAVWFISILSFLPFSGNSVLFGFTAALSFGLELRHLPYMWMGYYEGPGPWLRVMFTVLPVSIYLLFQLVRFGKKRSI